MLYPLKFKPVFKDYIWGGREIEKLGKTIPDGKVAESWEISSHPDGVSIVANGEHEGRLLTDLINEYKAEIVGSEIYNVVEKFPLLVKFIDANDKLSVQVHPRDEYAKVYENGELGKNEMWYILASKPGAKLVCGIRYGVTKEDFKKAVVEEKIEECLKTIDVFPGDFINIPAGLVHAIGEGILLAEIQQNSNTTYRVFDYNRVDRLGNKRPLHIEKALEVIDFNLGQNDEKITGLFVKLNKSSKKSYKIANKYFSIEEYNIYDLVEETTDGTKFCIYVFTEGMGEIIYSSGKIDVKMGDSILIPATLGEYTLKGELKALKTYVPNIDRDIIAPLKEYGYSEEDIYKNIKGLDLR